jgi:cell division protein FtsL
MTEGTERPDIPSQPAEALALPTQPKVLQQDVARRPTLLMLFSAVALVSALALLVYVLWLQQQRAELRAQLTALERRLVESREQLTAAEVAVQEKNAALATREVELAQATVPDLPVRVSFRPAFMGQGMVATFQNVGAEKLNLMVEFRDESLHATRDIALEVDAGGKADVGHEQGWLVNSGQSVRVSANGYHSVQAFAP